LWQIFFHHFSKVGAIFPFIYIIKFFKKSSSPLIYQANNINGDLTVFSSVSVKINKGNIAIYSSQVDENLYLWKSPEYQTQVSNDE